MKEWQPREKEGDVDKIKKMEREMITAHISTTWVRLAKERKTWKDHKEGYIRRS